MKSTLFIAALFCIAIGCNSSSNEASDTDSSKVDNTNIRGVENVNGNIPDTSATGATPNSPDNIRTHVDSTHVDTTRVKNMP